MIYDQCLSKSLFIVSRYGSQVDKSIGARFTSCNKYSENTTL